jgi:hypothetical protein
VTYARVPGHGPYARVPGPGPYRLSSTGLYARVPVPVRLTPVTGKGGCGVAGNYGARRG